MVATLRRAIERGELPHDLNIPHDLDFLAGPLYWQLTASNIPPEPGYLDAHRDAAHRLPRRSPLTSPTHLVAENPGVALTDRAGSTHAHRHRLQGLFQRYRTTVPTNLIAISCPLTRISRFVCRDVAHPECGPGQGLASLAWAVLLLGTCRKSPSFEASATPCCRGTSKRPWCGFSGCRPRFPPSRSARECSSRRGRLHRTGCRRRCSSQS
ncbi:TetR-like C-terminal domain-containing protein [Nocardia sp. NPDC023852]|uniref:TetR-like C-terminal domain-containing protein n=1 Tax=Nocardia sp. NPDC023852 TaxID=3154697 RepID=UPI0033F268D9